MNTTSTFDFFATCAKGFEPLLAAELSSLGTASVRTLQGQVAFSGSLADAYRVCLWSRIASRVVLVLAHGDAYDSDALYRTLSEVAWEDQLPLDATFAVDAHGTNNNLRNTQFVALRAKDAICDRCQAKLGGRPNTETHSPDITVTVRIRSERVTCGIDLSGTPLFRRGSGVFGKDDGLGGMRADYAAALLAAGGWYRCCRAENPVFVSMYSGAAALLVEAASVALDSAPGLHRLRWGFEHWLGHDVAVWHELLSEAEARAAVGAERASKVTLIGVDARPGSAAAARQALRSAGILVQPTVLADVSQLADTLAKSGISQEEAKVLAVADLTWLAPTDQVNELSALSTLANLNRALPSETSLVSISFTLALDSALGLEPHATYATMLGRNDAFMKCYTTNPNAVSCYTQIALKDGTTVPVMVPASDQFAARLAKVVRLRNKWARKEDITCYRVYDADLPDYAVAIDVYQASESSRYSDVGARWLVIQEYEAPKTVDMELAHRRLLDVLSIAPRILNVDASNVFVRVRKHAKGGSQYADGGKMGSPAQSRGNRANRTPQKHESRNIKAFRTAPGAHLVDEGGLVFEVAFSDRLDTGIFLDHRNVRAEVREMAKQTQGSKRFLNLFAYTGTATCYAADGGAKHTTTVDLSSTYLEWAQRNMAHNGFEGPEHEFVRADVVRWISEQRRTPNRWDLVFCDPPTFSNSKRMGRDVFDVQRDHAELLIGISRLLTQNGVCLFSCNLRGFKPDTEKLNRFGVQIEDVTQGSIPEDFSRNVKIHHCYLVRRTPRETA